MAVRHYVLLATDGYIELPADETFNYCPQERKKIYVWGFVGGLYQVKEKGCITYENTNFDWKDPKKWRHLADLQGTATIPSPMLWADVGDNLYVTLINLGMKHRPDLQDYHTLHLHGAHVATQLDGFPETSAGVPMWMDYADCPPALTYYFKPEHPGTLMYHCHVEASEHVQMGMYGALIIYPSIASLKVNGIEKKNGRWYFNGKRQCHIPKTATHRNFAYNNINSFFDKENVLLLSDLDTTWHEQVELNQSFKAADFKPDFWLVNGRAFPDTLRRHPLTPPSNSNVSLRQINYDSYVHVNTEDMFLLRMINLGYQPVPWHIHGWHFTIIGKDANPSPFLKLAEKMGHGIHCHEWFERGFTVNIGSGETYDLLITADDKQNIYRNYLINGQHGFSSFCEQIAHLKAMDPNSIFEIPVEPLKCPESTYLNYDNICRSDQGNLNFYPQFYPMHNHDDYKVTNSGADFSTYPGGQLTFIQVDALECKHDNHNNYPPPKKPICHDSDSSCSSDSSSSDPCYCK